MIGVAEPRIVAEVWLGSQHRPTGYTSHYYCSAEGDLVPAPPPGLLRIVQYDGHETSAYLLYFDDSGEELTDTWHRSIEAAMDQATAEFGVAQHEWDLQQ
jgi:hypothetical protein